MASELDKFFSLKSGSEVVGTLAKSNTTLNIDVIELKKIATGNTNRITTAAKKVELLKSTVENL